VAIVLFQYEDDLKIEFPWSVDTCVSHAPLRGA